MAKPIVSMTFRRSWGDFVRKHRGEVWEVCIDGVRKWFDVPEDAQAVRADIYRHPGRERYLLEPQGEAINDNPDWWYLDGEDPHIGRPMERYLDRLAKRHKGPLYLELHYYPA